MMISQRLHLKDTRWLLPLRCIQIAYPTPYILFLKSVQHALLYQTLLSYIRDFVSKRFQTFYGVSYKTPILHILSQTVILAQQKVFLPKNVFGSEVKK